MFYDRMISGLWTVPYLWITMLRIALLLSEICVPLSALIAYHVVLIGCCVNLNFNEFYRCWKACADRDW